MDYARLYRPFETWNEKKHPVGWFFEGTIEQVYRELLKPGDIAVDGGAALGRHTFPMADSVTPGGKIFAYEPGQPHYSLLSDKIRSQHFDDRVVLRNAALGKESGTASLFVHPKKLGLASLVNYFGSTDNLEIQRVELTTLDQDLALRSSRVRFIKLDLEGGELNALRGARQILNADKPVVALENNFERSSTQFGYDTTEYLQFFENMGYFLFDITGIPVTADLCAYSGYKPNDALAIPKTMSDYRIILVLVENYLSKCVPGFREALSTSRLP